MRCVVTGASGFLGRYVVEALLKRGVEVAGLVRESALLPPPWWGRVGVGGNSPQGKSPSVLNHPPLPNPPPRGGRELTVIHGDLMHPESYRQAFLDFKPNAVLHLGWAGVEGAARNDAAQARNVMATLKLVEMAGQANAAHFIQAGSQAEYGPLNRAIKESDPAEPTTLYGHAKLEAAQMAQPLCAAQEMRFVHVRIFSTYGPGNPIHWLIPYLITELLAGRKPKLTPCEQKWDFLYASDAAEAFAELLLTPKAEGIFNLGSGTAPPLRKTVERVRDLIDPALPLGFGEVPYRPDQVMHLEADISRLKNSTRWRPRVTLQEGLERTVRYVKQS